MNSKVRLIQGFPVFTVMREKSDGGVCERNLRTRCLKKFDFNFQCRPCGLILD